MKKISVVKVLIGLIVISATAFVLYYSTVFYLGSRDDYLESMTSDKVAFIGGRILINLVVGGILVGAFGVFALLYKKAIASNSNFSLKRLLLNYTALIVILSIIFVLLFYLR